MKYKYLHKSLRIGSIEIKNRLVMPPMATEKSLNGEVTDALCDYYDEITKGGYLGLVIQEHSYVSPEGKASPRQSSIARDSDVEGLSRVVNIIHNNGVKVFAQLAHAGSAAKREITGMDAISASAILNPCDTSARMGKQTLPLEMTQAEIDRVINCFADAAVRAKLSGYDGVEIHSAHGYLLDQFYSPLTNKRQDAYTGFTIEGRTLIHRKIIESIRQKVGAEFAISLRWGASDYTEGGATLDEVPTAAKMFVDVGVDMISISGGMCDYFRPGHKEPGWFAELSEAVKQSTSVPVLLTGGIENGDKAEKLLLKGSADMIGIGRALLKDSLLPKKIMEA